MLAGFMSVRKPHYSRAPLKGAEPFLWTLATYKITETLPDSGNSYVNSVAFSPDGTTLAVGADNSGAYLWTSPRHAPSLSSLTSVVAGTKPSNPTSCVT